MKFLGVLLFILWSPLLIPCFIFAILGACASYVFEAIYEPIYNRYLTNRE